MVIIGCLQLNPDLRAMGVRILLQTRKIVDGLAVTSSVVHEKELFYAVTRFVADAMFTYTQYVEMQGDFLLCTGNALESVTVTAPTGIPASMEYCTSGQVLF